MEAPEQLTLALFEPDPSERPQPHGITTARKRRGCAVAASRPQTQPAAEARSAPILLTTREAAKLLRVCPRTVQRLVERDDLRAVHLGAAVRFDPRDLIALTERLKRTTP